MKELKKIIKNKMRKFLIENKGEYKEIEFVCHNSNYEDSTNRELQKKLYEDLKELEIKTDYKIKPYMQDFCDDRHDEFSLAVIILDKQNEKYLEKEVMDLAKRYGIKFDLYNYRNEYQVNSIIRGDYYDNMA